MNHGAVDGNELDPRTGLGGRRGDEADNRSDGERLRYEVICSCFHGILLGRGGIHRRAGKPIASAFWLDRAAAVGCGRECEGLEFPDVVGDRSSRGIDAVSVAARWSGDVIILLSKSCSAARHNAGPADMVIRINAYRAIKVTQWLAAPASNAPCSAWTAAAAGPTLVPDPSRKSGR